MPEKKAPEHKDTVRNTKNKPKTSTQSYLPISEIRDNTVVLKNGGIRTIFKTSSINFNLKSEAEQNAIIYSYQSFLNTLEFPIQIMVRSQKLDLDNYVETLNKKAAEHENSLLKRQTYEYIEYIQKLVEYADIMAKEFYVIVPYDPYRAQKKGFLQRFIQHFKPQDTLVQIRKRHQEFEQLRKGLSSRVSIIKTGLENIGLHVDELNTHQLIELFYRIYNPTTSRGEKIRDNQNEISLVNDEDFIQDEKANSQKA